VLDFRTDRSQRPFLLNWQTGLYFPGNGGLFEYKSDVLRDVWQDTIDDEAAQWPKMLTGNPGPFQAAVGTTRGLGVAISSAHVNAVPQVFWLRKNKVHPAQTCGGFLAEQVLAVWLESRGSGRGRLWWGEGCDIGYCEWPSWTEDRYLSADSTYETDYGCAVQLPRFYGDRIDIKKDWQRVSVFSENAGAAPGIIEAWVSLDGAAYVRLPDVVASPVGNSDFPASTASYTIDIQLVLHGTSTSSSVRVRAVELLYQPLPETVRQIQLVLACRDNIQTHHGGQDTRTAGAIYAALSALAERDEPFVCTDELGTARYVRVLGVTKQVQRWLNMPGPQQMQAESAVIVTLMEVLTPGTSPAGAGHWYLTPP
jgi:hypothetical protein